MAVTLEELGDAWSQGRVHLTLQSTWNGRKVGMCEAGPEMAFHFGQLIAHVAATRNVRAGTIVGSGTVSNQGVQDASGRTDWPKGLQLHCRKALHRNPCKTASPAPNSCATATPSVSR